MRLIQVKWRKQRRTTCHCTGFRFCNRSNVIINDSTGPAHSFFYLSLFFCVFWYRSQHRGVIRYLLAVHVKTYSCHAIVRNCQASVYLSSEWPAFMSVSSRLCSLLRCFGKHWYCGCIACYRVIHTIDIENGCAFSVLTYSKQSFPFFW
jgi:hypothetical protein